MANRYDVFLSHSSADKPAVETLAHKLLEAKIHPFLDKWNLVPGEPWAEALEEALDQSRTCAVFVGPNGLGPWQNEEMRSALEEGVRNKAFRVIPILLPGSPKPQVKKLPRFLRRFTTVDFRAGLENKEAFRCLVHGIKGTSPGPGGGGGPVLPPSPISYRCMAQPPEGFIHRSEYEKVLEALCPKDGTSQVSFSVGITTGLRFAGGFGKTSLAQAVCFDERVRRYYPGGILWTIMGYNLDSEGRLSRIQDLLRWWTDTEPPGFKGLDVAGAKLREKLAGQNVLIVIDDVWSIADVTPFKGLGGGSALLITTRDSQTLPANSVPIEVDAMASSEAISLLRSGLPESRESAFASLAAWLGEWPLLLKLVNRQLREIVREDGIAIADALRWIWSALESEGFSAFNQDDPESRHAAASRTILVSVRRLPERDRDLYFQLSVFPEDAEIPLAILEGYWQLSPLATRKLCGRLHDLSLLRDFDVKNGTIRIHDVIRTILIEQIEDRISSLHARLLASHRPASGQWADLAEEAQYLWRNLAGHLIGADHIGELRGLLVEFSFLEAKLKTTDVNALISDYAGLTGGGQGFQLIQDSLRLSAHILGRDKRQLAPQLLGRLLNQGEEHIQRLLAGASSWQGGFWLRPRSASLTQPGGALIRVLEGHTDEVYAVAVVDKRVVSASKDGTLRVWDPESGRTLQTLEGHTDQVYGVAVLVDGRVVSASGNGTLRVWDLKSGRVLQTLEGHTDRVYAVAELADERVVSASADKTLRVWDLKSGRTLQTLKGHTDCVHAVAVLAGGRVVSASIDGTLRVWDLEGGCILQTLQGHSGSIYALAVLVSGCVVSASTDATLQVWDLESGRTLQILKGHRDGVLAVAELADGRVVSASTDWTLRVWDLESGLTVQTLEGHTGWVHAVAELADGRVVSASADRTLQVWGLERGSTPQTPERYTARVRVIAELSGGRVVSASADGKLRVWSLDSGLTVQTLEGHTDWVNALTELTGGRVVSAFEDRVREESGLTVQTLEGHTSWVHAVAVLADGRVVSSRNIRAIEVWSPKSGRTRQSLSLKDHKDWDNALAELPGGRVVSASDDGMLRVWDLESGRSLQILKGHTDWVNAVVELSGGRVISASDDRTLRVWDLESGRSLQTLKGHTNSVGAVAKLPGERVVSASNDRTLRVWDLESGETLAVVTLDAPPTAVVVSQDGRNVMAGDRSGKVHFFDWVNPDGSATW